MLVELHYKFSEQRLNRRIFSLKSAEQLVAVITGINLKEFCQRLQTSDQTGKFTLKVDDMDVQYSYGMSKMTVIDDNFGDKLYFRLDFVEFLEFLARLSLQIKLVEIIDPKEEKKLRRRLSLSNEGLERANTLQRSETLSPQVSPTTIPPESPMPIIEPREFSLNHLQKLFNASDKTGFDELKNIDISQPSEDDLFQSLSFVIEALKMYCELEMEKKTE